jgi:NitT/TauT family transport system substrate-binding protein
MWRALIGLLSALLLGTACASVGGTPARPPAAGGAAPAPGAAAPLGKVRAAYTTVSGSIAPLWLALDHGLWQRHGLEVELSVIAGAPIAIAALLAGEIQFAYASGESGLSAQVREPDLVGLLSLNTGITHGLLVQPGIERLEDLRGKRIGVFTVGDGNYMLMSRALRQLGLDPERDVVWTPVGGGNFAGLVQALAAGSIDATLLPAPNDLAAIRNGSHLLLRYRDLGLPWISLIVYTLRPTLEQQRPVVEAFAKGVIDGVRLYRADPDLAKQALAKWTGLTDPEALDWTYEAFRESFTDRPFINLELVREVVETLAVHQPELRQLPLERVIDRSVLESLERQGYFAAR